jgi:hypothetical protein
VGYFRPGHSSELRNRWPRKGGGRGLKRASPATIGRDVNSSRTRATTRHSACTSNQEIYERLSPSDLKQAAVVEATFLYNAARCCPVSRCQLRKKLIKRASRSRVSILERSKSLRINEGGAG